MISGSGEYKSEPSLKAFAELLKNHYGARCTLSLGKDGIAELRELARIRS